MNNTFCVSDFGMVEGLFGIDVKANTLAVKAAVEACASNGGGEVLFPKGCWRTGPIHLRSHVKLNLGEGAYVVFEDDPKMCLPLVKTTWEGVECMNYSPLVYAFECEDVGIIGKGTLAPKMTKWREWFVGGEIHRKVRGEIYDMMSRGEPIENRILAERGGYFRPQLLQFNRCRNVILKDFRIRESPFWTIHIFRCNGVEIRGLDSRALGHNSDGINLEKTKKLLVVGENAIKMMTVGGGSSSLKVQHECTPLEGILAAVGDKAEVVYERGYVGDVTGDYNGVVTGQDLSESRSEDKLIADAVAAAKDADAVIFIGGLNKSAHQDCEDSDRYGLELPYAQDKTIEALAAVNPNLTVVIVSGNAVAMPWVDKVNGIVETWFSGSQTGHALADVLFGKVNPSGKLPFTFPVKLEDNAAHALDAYDPEDLSVEYKEGIFVGYRWAEKEQIKPLFAFGHGLSYTDFGYGEAKAARTSMKENGTLSVSVDVTNTGDVAGKEVIQLYIGDNEASVARPVKELKGFRKIALEPGQKQTVTFEITPEMLKFFDADKHEWVLEKGKFTAFIGAASDDIRTQVEFEVI